MSVRLTCCGWVGRLFGNDPIAFEKTSDIAEEMAWREAIVPQQTKVVPHLWRLLSQFVADQDQYSDLLDGADLCCDRIAAIVAHALRQCPAPLVNEFGGRILKRDRAALWSAAGLALIK